MIDPIEWHKTPSQTAWSRGWSDGWLGLRQSLGDYADDDDRRSYLAAYAAGREDSGHPIEHERECAAQCLLTGAACPRAVPGPGPRPWWVRAVDRLASWLMGPPGPTYEEPRPW